jgi:hypothetical protein
MLQIALYFGLLTLFSGVGGGLVQIPVLFFLLVPRHLIATRDGEPRPNSELEASNGALPATATACQIVRQPPETMTRPSSCPRSRAPGGPGYGLPGPAGLAGSA